MEQAPSYVQILRVVDAVVLSGLTDPAEESVVLNLAILAKLSQFFGAVVL